MKANELRGLSQDELKQKLDEQNKELFKVRLSHSTAQLENTARIPGLKKDIARIQTVLREKERG